MKSDIQQEEEKLKTAIANLGIIINIDGVDPNNDNKPLYSKATLVSYFPNKENDINKCFTKDEKEEEEKLIEGKKEGLQALITNQLISLFEPYIKEGYSIKKGCITSYTNITPTKGDDTIDIYISNDYFSKQIDGKKKIILFLLKEIPRNTIKSTAF